METVFDDGEEKPVDSSENNTYNERAATTLGSLGWLSCQTVGGFSEIIMHPPSRLMFGVSLGESGEGSLPNTFTGRP